MSNKLVFLTFVVALVLIGSCSLVAPDWWDSQQIIGTWVTTSGWADLTFQDGGVGYANLDPTDTFTWEITGGALFINYGGVDEFSYELSGDSLRLYEKADLSNFADYTRQ